MLGGKWEGSMAEPLVVVSSPGRLLFISKAPLSALLAVCASPAKAHVLSSEVLPRVSGTFKKAKTKKITRKPVGTISTWGPGENAAVARSNPTKKLEGQSEQPATAMPPCGLLAEERPQYTRDWAWANFKEHHEHQHSPSASEAHPAVLTL